MRTQQQQLDELEALSVSVRQLSDTHDLERMFASLSVPTTAPVAAAASAATRTLVGIDLPTGGRQKRRRYATLKL